MKATADVITRVTVRGMRCLRDVSVELRQGVQVLIGENGSGKSTFVEALEILRRVPNRTFWNDLNTIHGGVRGLKRDDSDRLAFSIEVTGGDKHALTYSFDVDDKGFVSESLLRDGRTLLERGRHEGWVLGPDGKHLSLAMDGEETRAMIWQNGRSDVDAYAPMRRMAAALSAIDVQVPFDTSPLWLSKATARKAEMRNAQPLFHVTQLERMGANVAAAYDALHKNFSRAELDETLELVRLGLGDWVEDVIARADDAGQVSLWLKVAGRDERIAPAGISAGQLAYLGLVALTRLKPIRSLLVFDEPEQSLHPVMLPRVLELFDRVVGVPIVLATHSRRLLDGLQYPAKQAILFELDAGSLSTRVMRPNAKALARWLVEFDGLGKVLDHGLGKNVMSEAKRK